MLNEDGSRVICTDRLCPCDPAAPDLCEVYEKGCTLFQAEVKVITVKPPRWRWKAVSLIQGGAGVEWQMLLHKRAFASLENNFW